MSGLMSDDAQQNRWMSVDEIADYLGVSKDTVYAWINGRGMPAHKIVRLWKFKRDEVDTWIRAGGPSDRAVRGPKRSDG